MNYYYQKEIKSVYSVSNEILADIYPSLDFCSNTSDISIGRTRKVFSSLDVAPMRLSSLLNISYCNSANNMWTVWNNNIHKLPSAVVCVRRNKLYF